MKTIKIIRRFLWLGTSLVFLLLIIDSYQGMKTSYPTFEYRIPSNYNIQIGNVRFQEVINEFADRFDDHVTTIGSDLKKNARIAFITYIVSFFLSLIGFFLEYKEEQKKNNSPTSQST